MAGRVMRRGRVQSQIMGIHSTNNKKAIKKTNVKPYKFSNMYITYPIAYYIIYSKKIVCNMSLVF